MVKTITYIAFVLTICSCSPDKQTVTRNPFDTTQVFGSTFFSDKKQEGIRYCSDEELREAGYGCTNTLPIERLDWMRNFKVLCSSYTIRKKDFLKFIDLINKTDSLKIINYDKTWIENFNEKPVKKKQPYEWFSLYLPQEQIATIMVGRQDSIPILISLASDENKKITMSLCVDSITSRQIFQFLTEKQLATLKR